MRTRDPQPNKLANYVVGILGKTFTVIQTPDIRPGDMILDFQVDHIHYEKPRKAKKVTRITDNFYDIEFEDHSSKTLPRYSKTCIFGRMT